jgi:hypothetical protein
VVAFGPPRLRRPARMSSPFRPHRPGEGRARGPEEARLSALPMRMMGWGTTATKRSDDGSGDPLRLFGPSCCNAVREPCSHHTVVGASRAIRRRDAGSGGPFFFFFSFAQRPNGGQWDQSPLHASFIQ